ncbi:hypothetical protein ACQ4PT_027898 [Festuca glaucescens]
MFATHGHRRRRERGVHAHGDVARKRASLSPPLVLLCSIGAIVFLANARHVLFPKESFLGSFWSTPTCKPQGVKYELRTLPVDAKAVADGDTITVYVDMANPHESRNVPHEVQEAAVERIKARAAKNYQKADALQKIIVDAGYRQLPNPSGDWGAGSCKEVPDQAKEHMLKKGLAWHYTAYDRRQELAKWESQTRASRLGLWALPNSEKPWEWRKEKRMRKW